MDAKGIVSSLFGVSRALIGVIHTGGLPGTPNAARDIDETAAHLTRQAIDSGAAVSEHEW